MTLTLDELGELKKSFYDLINYESSNPSEPIDPTTYIDSNGDNCLHIAAQRNDYRAVQLLVASRAIDVNSRGDMGCTALHYARANKYHEIEQILIDNGALDNIENDFGELP